MAFKFKVTEGTFVPLDERQWYPARLLSVETDEITWNNQTIPKFRFNFVILDPENFEGRELNGMVNQPTGDELTERHTLFKWITALRGGRPPSVDEEIDFPDQFIGKIVLVKVKSTRKNYQGRDMVFQNVSQIAICDPTMAADLANRAPDKMPEGATPPAPNLATTTPQPAPQPQAQPAPVQTAPAPAPQPTPNPAPAPARVQQRPNPQPAQPAPATAQPVQAQTAPATAQPQQKQQEQGGKIIVDGEEVSCPF